MKDVEDAADGNWFNGVDLFIAVFDIKYRFYNMKINVAQLGLVGIIIA
jgi:hypothetical protein